MMALRSVGRLALFTQYPCRLAVVRSPYLAVIMETSQLRKRMATKAQQDPVETVKEDVSKPVKEPVRYTGPELRPLQIPEGKFFTIVGLLLSGLMRALTGVFVEGYSLKFGEDPPEGVYRPPVKIMGKQLLEKSNTITSMKRPEQPLVIYEFEACPFCKKVREACTLLDLDVLFYPTPKGGPTHRAKVKELGGKEQFPYMIDPNTGRSMYESDAIVEYLYMEYGNGKVPLAFRLGFLTTLTLGLSGLSRFGRGITYRKAKYPEEPLMFWAYEGSPFSKLAREVLVELELPFRQIYCARGSAKRQELVDKMGVFQAPFLDDPNTGVKMFESQEIIKYLENTYAL